jgi:hypothetical protein
MPVIVLPMTLTWISWADINDCAAALPAQGNTATKPTISIGLTERNMVKPPTKRMDGN